MEVEQRLSAVLSEFARTLVTDFPIQAILDHLVVRIVDVLPIDAAGVTLITPGTDPHYIAASDESAMRYERLQSEIGEGPCVAAYESGEAVSVPDLRIDEKFLKFSPRAVEAGLVAVFTFPLRQEGKQLGALDLYRTEAGPLDDTAMAAAQTLADVASAYLANAQNRVDLEASSQRAEHNSLHDALTGLPNRTLLVERLEHAILRCRRSHKMVAIMFTDLDGFKAVNDTYGHQTGDELLSAVASRLTRLLRPGDTLARMSGDEFVILCEDLEDTAPVDIIAHRIETALATPFSLSGAEVRVSASVGIAFAGRGDDMPERVLEVADIAMYQAKRSGGGRHAVIDLREHGNAVHQADLNRDLRGAVGRGELRLHYQPIVAVATGAIIGVEALLRWAHPTQRLVEPDRIIPLAEQSGLIGGIGCWVLERACLDRHLWGQHHPDYTGLGIAVNVSAHQLKAVDFPASIARVLDETSTDAALVTLEVTESVFIDDSERALVVLNELKRLGVRIALDDFGTGYSSLSYLRHFPVDVVKIDRSFVADLGRDPTSRLIVSAVVDLAHALDLSIVAEGVESKAQYDHVADLACDAYQGFLFARPMPASNVDTLLGSALAVATADVGPLGLLTP